MPGVSRRALTFQTVVEDMSCISPQRVPQVCRLVGIVPVVVLST